MYVMWHWYGADNTYCGPWEKRLSDRGFSVISYILQPYVQTGLSEIDTSLISYRSFAAKFTANILGCHFGAHHSDVYSDLAMSPSNSTKAAQHISFIWFAKDIVSKPEAEHRIYSTQGCIYHSLSRELRSSSIHSMVWLGLAVRKKATERLWFRDFYILISV